MEQSLAGRVALVTGASQGLGRTLAVRLAARGARVATLARNAAALDALAAQVGDACLPLPCDLRDPAAIAAAVAMAIDRFGGIDILVNNAVLILLNPIDELSENDARAEMETNLLAPVLLSRAVVPAMQARGGGHIINVSSEAVGQPMPFLSLYAAAKAGLESFSAALRVELAPRGIRVGVFRSGFMGESASSSLWGDERKKAFYAALKATGLDHFAGTPIPLDVQADALIAMLTVPAPANVDHMTVRSIGL